jgi:chromosome segregation ATPase
MSSLSTPHAATTNIPLASQANAKGHATSTAVERTGNNADFAHLKRELEALRCDKAEYNAKVASLQESLKEQAQHHENEKKTLSEELRSHSSLLEKETEKTNNALEKEKLANYRAASTFNYIHMLNKNAESAKKEVEELRKDLDAQKDLLAKESEAKLSAMQMRAESAGRYSDATVEISKLKTSLIAREKEVGDTRVELDKQKRLVSETRTQATQEIKNLKDSLITTKTDLLHRQRIVVESLNTKLEEAREKNKVLKLELAEYSASNSEVYVCFILISCVLTLPDSTKRCIRERFSRASECIKFKFV